MNWVVTSCDSNGFDEMLVPFLASLKEVAMWKGEIAVIDLGLTLEHKDFLKANNVSIFQQSKKSKAIVCDRFFSLLDNMNDDDIYAHYDADVWFTSSLDELFKDYDNKLICTIDCNYQSFITGVIPDKENKEKYNQIIKRVIAETKKPLQVGFLCGNKKAFSIFTNTMMDLISNGIAADAYGTDTLAINVAYHHHKDNIRICDIGYNCLPDWRPEFKDGSFTYNGNPVQTIHRTSPYRKDNTWAFSKYFPQIFRKWKSKYIPSKEIIVTVKNLKYHIRDQTWDHTVLYHSNDYTVSKHLNIRSDVAIVDIGAHIGGFTKLVASHYPHINIYAFEPDPDNFKLLVKNTSELKNVKTFNYAIGAFSTFGEIEKPEESNTGMNRVRPGKGAIQIISVDDLFSLIQEKEIALLKIDCEGGEWPFFDTICQEQYKKIWEIQGELHADLFTAYTPNRDAAIPTETQMREILKNKLKQFSVFIDSGRILKAYNQEQFL